MSKKQVYYDDSSKHNLTGGKWVYVDENGVPLNRESLRNYDLSNPIYYSNPSQNPRRGNEFKGDDTQNEGALAAHVESVRKGQENLQRIKDQALNVAGFVPFLGDALDIGSAASDVANQNYLSAGTTLGLMFLPEILAKPIQKGFRYARQVIKPSSSRVQDVLDTKNFISQANKFFDYSVQGDYARINGVKSDSSLGQYKDLLSSTFNINYPRTRVTAQPGSYFEQQIGGAYYPSLNLATLNMKSPDIDNTYLHEALSHSTDDIVKDMNTNISDYEILEFPFIPTGQTVSVKRAYQSLSDPYLDNITPSYKWSDSLDWAEARATNNELRYNLLKKGEDLSNLPDNVLLEGLKQTNDYGKDYVSYYRTLSPESQKKYLDRWRKALMYLPVAAIGVTSINNEE